jgi:hypothetical protein
MSGMNQSAVRRVNTSVVLRALAVSAGPTTLTALAEGAGLSRRTIELILDSLVEAGWVPSWSGYRSAAVPGDRPAGTNCARSTPCWRPCYINTADASAVIADVRGRIVGRAHRPLRAYQDPQVTLDDAAALVREALDDAGGSPDRLRAGAVAAGGAIDDEGVVRRLVHTTRWEGVHLPKELEQRIRDALVRGQRLQPRCAGGALAGCGR